MNLRLRSASLAAALLAALSGAATPARAVELAEGKLSLNFAGGWVYAVTDKNAYDTGFFIGTPKGLMNNGELNLTVIAHPFDKVTFAAQLAFDDQPDGQSAGLDWAFGEYAFSDSFKLRAGKVKLPVGLMNEVEGIGTLRPLYSLPTGLYGNTTVAGLAYYGVGITGRVPAGSFTVGYDLFGGQTVLQTNEPYTRLTGPLVPGTVLGPVDDPVTRMVGARLRLETPLQGLEFQLSGYRGDLIDATIVSGVLSAQYVDENWSIRSEGFIASEAKHSYGAYLEVARFLFDEHWQLVGRSEIFKTTTDLNIDPNSNLLLHREFVLGLNYWVNTSWVFKAAVHDVFGNRLAFPAALDDALAAGLSPRTRMFTLSTQFAY